VNRLFRGYAGLIAAIVVLVAIFGAATEYFFSAATFRTIASQIPDAVVVAVGMTFVLIVGGIDLSVGSVLALSATAFGGAVIGGWPLPLAVGACLLVGLACGTVNAAVIVGWRVPSFIVTLGMLEMARGGAYLATGSQTQYLGALLGRLEQASVLGLPWPFAVALALVVVGQFVLSKTIFGRYVIAVGANEEAARLSGIDPRPIRFAAFAIAGLLAGAGAIMQATRLAAADPNAGTGFELRAIAAVVIGGTSLTGGRGSVVSSFLGVIIMAVLASGLAQVGVQEPTKRLVTGAVIVGAVVLDRYRAKRIA
jgi:ribose transport system permease protein